MVGKDEGPGRARGALVLLFVLMWLVVIPAGVYAWLSSRDGGTMQRSATAVELERRLAELQEKRARLQRQIERQEADFLLVDVVDAEGAPTAGADVRVLAAGGGEVLDEQRTGAGGRARFAPFEPLHDVVAVVARHDGRVAVAPRIDAVGTARLVLRPGRPLAVRVVEPDGTPAVGVTVKVRTQVEESTGADVSIRRDALRDGTSLWPTPLVLEEVSAGDGVADFGVVPLGVDRRALEIVVDEEPWVGESRRFWGPPPSDLVIALRRAVTVRGRLLGEVSRLRRVVVRDLGSGRRVEAAADGRFELPFVDAAGGLLVVEIDPANPHTIAAPRVLARPRVEKAVLELGDVRVPAPARLRGVVTWPDGAPAGGVAITARALDDRVDRRAWRTFTDGQGRFETAELARVPHRLEAFVLRPEGHEGPRHVTAGLLTAVPPDELRLVLDRDVPELWVTVVDADGHRVEAGHVDAWPLGFRTRAPIERGMAFLPLRGPPPWEIDVRVPGFRSATIVVEDGEGAIEREVRLERRGVR